jgi:hypothetical protein
MRVIQRPAFFPAKGLPKPTPKQQALKEWRRIDLREQEGTLGSKTKSIADLIPKVVEGMGLDRKRGELEILKVWNALLDPQITAHAQPVNLAKGTLFVNVDSNAWLSEIVRYRRKEILERLKNAFGKDLIQKISFRVG